MGVCTSILGCVATSWKSSLLLRGTACLMGPEKNTAPKRWLPKGRTGPVPKRKKLVQRVPAWCTGAGAGPTAADSSGKESWSAGSWEQGQRVLPRGPRADPPQPNPTDPGAADCLDNRWIYMFALSLKSSHSPCQIPKNAAFCQQALLLFYLDGTMSIRLSSRHWGPLWIYTGITPMLLRSESGSGWTETEITPYHAKETKKFVMNCDVTENLRRLMGIDRLKVYSGFF